VLFELHLMLLTCSLILTQWRRVSKESKPSFGNFLLKCRLRICRTLGQVESYNFCPAIATYNCPPGGDCKKKKDHSDSVINDENSAILKEIGDKISSSLYKNGKGYVPWPFKKFMIVQSVLLIFVSFFAGCL